MNDGFTELTSSEAWNPKEVGDQITGTYLVKQTNVGPNQSNMYQLRTTTGDTGVWGSAVIDSNFDRVGLGDIVRITYLGKSDKSAPGKQPYKNYKFEVKPGAGLSAPAAETTATEGVDEDDY